MNHIPYLQILLLLSGVWIIGRIFHRFKWPSLFGELLAGIILGPVFLGVIEEGNTTIQILADLGIFFLMLHAGLETSPKDLFKASGKALIVASGGVILPFIMGYFTSTLFGYSPVQSLFIATGLSITAIAVSAKLFKDCNINNSEIAHITLGAAIIDDIMGLILLSIVLSVASENTVNISEILFLTLKIILFFGAVLFVGQKVFPKLQRVMQSGNKGFTFTIIIALLFGVVAEALHIHIIVGAFLAGLFIREEVINPGVFNKIEDRVYGLSYSFLGPIFFASLAFHLDFGILKSAGFFTITLAFVAIISKVLGAGLAAKIAKVNNINSLGIGLAMNSRGAVELIIAVIGLERGIIDQTIFSALVFMAFITTLVSILGLKPISQIIKKQNLST